MKERETEQRFVGTKLYKLEEEFFVSDMCLDSGIHKEMCLRIN